MLKAERKLVAWFSRNVLAIGFVFALFVTLAARYRMLDFRTNDMNAFLLPWVEQFRQRGVGALAEGIGDYNIPYMFFLSGVAAATKTEEGAMLFIKLVSLVFDYLLAFGIAAIVYELRDGEAKARRLRWAGLAMVITLLVPTILLNSALWGQCDSIYACFGIWAVYFMLRDKKVVSIAMFSLALCFKLQAIFLLPFLLIVYFVRRGFTALYFLIAPLLLFIGSLPAVVLGAKWNVGFTIYMEQTTAYEEIFIDYPSIAALSQDERYEFFGQTLTLLAMLLCLGMLAFVLYNRLTLDREGMLAVAVWSVCVCICFLPSIHERYGYMAEALVWAAFFARPCKRTLVPALVFTFTGYCSYAGFLFHFQPVPFQYLALANLFALGWHTWHMVKRLPARERSVH